MDLFRSYQLIETKDGYDLILYVDTNMDDVEFAEEFGKIDEDNKKRLNDNIIDYIKEKFPDIKINMVKVMAGTVLLSSFMLGAPIKSHAAQTAASGLAYNQGAYNYNIKISVNGNLQNFSARPFIYNNTTYVPLYDFGKAIGGSVWWNNTSNTVGINKNNNMIAFMRGSSLARVNGVQVKMPPSIVIEGITFAPVRFIAENLGYKVELDTATQTVNITNQAIKKNNTYTVVAGDSLWLIANKFGTSVAALKSANNLSGDIIYPGQILVIPDKSANTAPAPSTGQNQAPAPQNNTKWPDVTYIVQPGDTVTSVAKKFGVSVQDILKYNYMEPDEWLNAGDKIAISGYAPRVTTVRQGESAAPARRGTPVDWNLEGQYLIKRGDVFTIVDVDTGKQFKAKMIGGYNHADIEPLTTADTNIMKSLFGEWKWSPRAVVVFHNGMNIAASLSGMPHGVDTIENGVNGHFDLYLKNSTSHSTSTSKVYIQEHQNMVMKASGK
ncbi:MAG: LysM peptidoglycan-binding domain-containing protein [Clostridiaceae bacterium]|nr:LysM peptidoglycan-binding domain-containing protein [Clostridiaceae bacterium]